MAETNIDKKLEEAKASAAPDFSKALKHLEAVEKYLFGRDEKGVPVFEGKPGFNPFLFKVQQIEPLKARYEAGERGYALYDAMIAVKQVPPDGSNLKIASLLVTERRNLGGALKTDV